ncbi:MAG: hypothetical protein V1882_12825 [Candidatus Omnitrophota bacterium]
MRNYIILVIMFVTIAGPSFAIALISHAAIISLGRNPSSGPKIITAMVIGLIFAEAVAVISLLVLFQLFAG